MAQRSQYFSRSEGASAIGQMARDLGDLPPIVRYFDEYEEKTHSVISSEMDWAISANGEILHLRFSRLQADEAEILKHFALNRLHKNAVTAANFVRTWISTRKYQIKLLEVACADPHEAINYLRTDFFAASREADNTGYFRAGKSLIAYFCELNVGGWDASFSNILRSIGSPYEFSKHRTVRDGSAIISFEEERKIIAHFDDLNAELLRGSHASVRTTDLRDACVLFWNYAHAMRPIQIANRDVGHVRLRTQEEGNPVIHLTFRYAKQRGNAKALEQTRKMKRDWTPMMAAWLTRRASLNPAVDFDRPNSLFGVSPSDITTIVAGKTEQITGVRRVPYDLRHSAAQRKADAGCSRIELAEFLMHQDIDTADTYIQMSPTQAEKINQALGLSPLFQAIDKALKARSVTLDELNDLPNDMQVGSAPHGHLIAGIGGCAIGQSFCTKTPALACYGCAKFMYLRDAAVHRAARDSVQQIVQEFVASGRTDRVSPAFMQLREVIEIIDAIVEDLAPTGPEQAQ